MNATDRIPRHDPDTDPVTARWVLGILVLLAAVMALLAGVAGTASADPGGAGFSECAKLDQVQKRLCKDGVTPGPTSYAATVTPATAIASASAPATFTATCNAGDTLIAVAAAATELSSTGDPVPVPSTDLVVSDPDVSGGFTVAYIGARRSVTVTGSGTCQTP